MLVLRPKTRGCHKPWFAGSLCLCGPRDPSPTHQPSTCLISTLDCILVPSKRVQRFAEQLSGSGFLGLRVPSCGGHIAGFDLLRLCLGVSHSQGLCHTALGCPVLLLFMVWLDRGVPGPLVLLVPWSLNPCNSHRFRILTWWSKGLNVYLVIVLIFSTWDNST